MKKRKLLSPTAYIAVHARLNMGVPLSRIIKDLQVAMSRPALSKLLAANDTSFSPAVPVDDSIAIQNSLNPKWIDYDGPLVQEQPDDWKYVGYFPYGVWTHEND
jgi:hypothetical protein